MAKRFTNIYIKSLKPKAERYDVREAEGFAIRVFPSGERSWIYFYHHLSRKRRMTLGRYPAMSLRAARIAHAEAHKTLASGTDPAAQKKAVIEAQTRALQKELREPTVKALVEEYLEGWAKPRKRSWPEDQRILYKDVVPAWGRRKAKEIERRDVVLLLDRVKTRGGIMANQTLAVIRRMFNYAIERDILNTNPAAHIKPPTPPRKRDRVLTPDEIHALWSGLDTAPMTEHVRLALRLLLITGQRPGEVINMEWSEIEADWWIIPRDKAKNHELHRVPLSAMALEVIERLRTIRFSSTWVFPSPRTSNDQPIAATAVDHAVRRSTFPGVEKFTPHDLRRTVGTSLGQLGFNRLVQDKVLNHKDNSVGGIYDRHSYDKEKRLALEAWAQHLQTILDGKPSTGNVVTLSTAY